MYDIGGIKLSSQLRSARTSDVQGPLRFESELGDGKPTRTDINELKHYATKLASSKNSFKVKKTGVRKQLRNNVLSLSSGGTEHEIYALTLR